MTDIYRISIDDKTSATLRGRVHIINPDAEDVPPGRDFPLRMIIEVWHRTREGFFFTHDRLDADRLHRNLGEAAAIANEMELKSELERLQGLDRGVKVYLTDEEAEEVRAAGRIRNKEQKKASRRALVERYGVKFTSLGNDGAWYIQGKRDGRAFYKQACEIVTDYRVGEMENWPPHWELTSDEYEKRFGRRPLKVADYPYAEFTFTVKDARYLEHMDRGIHFSSAIYGEYGW